MVAASFFLIANLAVGSALMGEEIKLDVSLDAKPIAANHYAGKAGLTLPDGWHSYSNPPASQYETPTALSVTTKDFKLVKVQYPKGVPGPENNSIYEGSLEIPFELKWVGKGKAPTSVVLSLKYQMCDDRTCLPPTSTTVKLAWPPKAPKKPAGVLKP